MSASALAERFRDLHGGPQILRLANAWDPGSAVAFEACGCPALGTTSAGVANALGCADGAITREQMLDATARIVAAVAIPVSADIETGFGATPAAVAQTVTAVLECGAVGVNIEDAAGTGLLDVPEQAKRVRAAKDAGGDDVFINARTDVYWLGIGSDEDRLALTIERAAAYGEAGADGIFVPGATDPDAIAALVAGIGLPLNILAGPATPAAPALERLGVARVSTGSGPARAALTVALRAGRELMDAGTYEELSSGAVSYIDANALFSS